jgi:gluconolactonase
VTPTTITSPIEVVAHCDGLAGGVTTDGETVLFSAVDASMVLRFDPRDDSVTTPRRFTSRTNGLAFSADGILYAAQSGSRRVLRLNDDGSSTLLVERIGGSIHNHPADVAVDSAGRVWFSDRYSTIPAPGAQIFGRLGHQSVLRLHRTPRREWALTRMTHDTVAPYGVEVSADGGTLFVTENDPAPDGRREVRAYPIADDGTLGRHRVLLSFGADPGGPHRGPFGVAVVGADVLVCAGGPQGGPGPLVYRLTATGRVLETIPVEGRPVGCAVLGEDLYVTTEEGRLLRLRGVARSDT